MNTYETKSGKIKPKVKGVVAWREFRKGLLGEYSRGSLPLEIGLEALIQDRISTYDVLEVVNSSRLSGNGKSRKDNFEFVKNLAAIIAVHLSKLKISDERILTKFTDRVLSDDRNRVITFNYDLLVDKKFLEKGRTFKNLYFGQSPLLLKLHGSLNWGCDSERYKMLFEKTPSKNKAKLEIREFLPESGFASTTSSRVIVPPMPAKPLTEVSEFREIWTRAFEYLSDAADLIIFGYSCPESDQLARALLANLKPGRNSTGPIRITIIDPNPDTYAKFRRLLNPDYAGIATWRHFSSLASYLRFADG